MAALKKSDREDVLWRVLTEAFAPRFRAVEAEITRLSKEALVKEHPVFCTPYADPANLGYMTVTRVSRILSCSNEGKGARILAAPIYGLKAITPTGCYVHERENIKALRDAETAVPGSMFEFRFCDEAVVEQYDSAWADYTWVDYKAAYRALAALLNSCGTHEKLVVDSPEYARHLPPPEVKAKPPAVIVADVRAGLAALGVPA